MGASQCHSIPFDLKPTAFTNGLFQTAREFLANSTYRDGLAWISDRDVRIRYRDPIDFLFCRLLVGYRDACEAFYQGRGPMLAELRTTTDVLIKGWDDLLSGAILVAAWCKFTKRKVTWNEFCDLAFSYEAGAR
jgi:hypothetical protein